MAVSGYSLCTMPSQFFSCHIFYFISLSIHLISLLPSLHKKQEYQKWLQELLQRYWKCGLWPYKTTVMYPPQPSDPVSRHNLCNCYLHSVWRYLKTKVYQTNPYKKEKLRNHSCWSSHCIQRTTTICETEFGYFIFLWFI
jgi:hypothetical protein